MGTAVFCGAIFLSTGVPSRRVLFAVFEQPGLPPISVRTRALRSGLVAMGHPFVEWALAACLAASGGGGAPMHLGAVFYRTTNPPNNTRISPQHQESPVPVGLQRGAGSFSRRAPLRIRKEQFESDDHFFSIVL